MSISVKFVSANMEEGKDFSLSGIPFIEVDIEGSIARVNLIALHGEDKVADIVKLINNLIQKALK